MSGGQRGGRSGRKSSSASQGGREGRGRRAPGGPPPRVPMAATSLPEPGRCLPRRGQPASAGAGCPGCLPPARQAVPGEGRVKGEEDRRGPPAPRKEEGDAAEPGPAPPAGSAGRGGGAEAGRAALRRKLQPPARRLPPAHLSGEGGRGAGERPPLSPAPQLCPGPTFSGTSQAGSAPAAARPLPPRASPPEQPPAIAELRFPYADFSPFRVFAPSRVFLHFCQFFPSLLSDFYLTSAKFLPQFFCRLPPPPPQQIFPLSVKVGMREELFPRAISSPEGSSRWPWQCTQQCTSPP